MNLYYLSFANAFIAMILFIVEVRWEFNAFASVLIMLACIYNKLPKPPNSD